MKSISEHIENPINESQAYDDLIKYLQDSKENGVPLTEGIIGGLFGGIAGFAAGPMIMKAVCNTLGIDLKGPLGSLMTSRLIITACCAKLGLRI